jgi:DNA-binding CsgD family transcriptional regulator
MPRISETEREVLTEYLRGRSANAIAKVRDRKVSTIATQIRDALRKLGLSHDQYAAQQALLLHLAGPSRSIDAMISEFIDARFSAATRNLPLSSARVSDAPQGSRGVLARRAVE